MLDNRDAETTVRPSRSGIICTGGRPITLAAEGAEASLEEVDRRMAEHHERSSTRLNFNLRESSGRVWSD